MATGSVCGKCGAELTGVGAEQLCPGCLLEGGLASRAPDGNTAGQSPIANRQSPIETLFPRPFGDYELLEEIARGGMGVVYKARQVSLDRVVAVKMLLFGPLAKPEFVQRFRTEAAAAASLQHPNIVAIHEVGYRDAQHFFAMDYVAGSSLADIVRNGPLPARRAAGYVKTIAEAIHYAHERAILHRDLKPSNVLIDAATDQPRVTDFGLAKRLGGSRDESRGSRASVSPTGSGSGSRLSAFDSRLDLTLSGQILGTPNYMPPEQAAADRGLVGKRSDVYSLGAILYHLLTGRPPFQAETLSEILSQVLNRDPVSPRLLNSSVPRDLETICLKCLEKEPARRYQSADALADELGRVLRDEPIRARPVSPAEKVWRWCRRKPALAASLLALHIVFALGLAGIVWQWQRAETNARQEARERRRADTNALAEFQQHKLAEVSAAQSKERLVRLNVANGIRLLEAGDSLGSLVWFAQALDLVRDEPDKTFVHQLRLQSVISHCPKLLQMWFHRRTVNCAVFSPDGRFVVTASADRTARVWDVETGQPAAPPLRHAGPVESACFSPDGTRILAAAGADVRVWDARTGETNFVLTHSKAEDAVFSPDGQWIATASADRTIKIWDARTGREKMPPLTHTDRLGADHYNRHLSFSPDGRSLVTASYGNAARVWNVQTGELLFSLVHNQTVRHACFSPDGTLIATANWANTAHLWDASTGREVLRPLSHGAMVDHVTFSPDGKWLVTVGGGDAIKVWDVKTGNLTRSLPGNESIVMESVFSPDGSLLMTRQLDGWVRVWSARHGELTAPPLRHSWWATSARFHPDGRRVLTASADGSIRLWDLEPEGLQFWPWTEERMQAVGWSPDRSRILAENGSGQLQSWDVQTWKPDAVAFSFTNEVVQGFFSQDDRRLLTVEKLFLTGSGSGIVRDLKLWERASGTLLHHARLQFQTSAAEPQMVVASPDCAQVALASEGNVETWDVVANKRLWRVEKHLPKTGLLGFSPDARQVVFNCGRLLHVINAATGRLLYRNLTNHLILHAAQFSPDGRWLATVDSDASYRHGEARIWDAATGKLRHALRHADGVLCAAFSPDGRWLATGGESKEARVFDVESGKPVSARLRHAGGVSSVAFSHDGRFLATGTGSRAAHVWDISTGEPVTPPLKHSHHVDQLFFLVGDRVLVTRSSGSFRFWRLQAEQQPLEELQARARVLAAHDLDPSGAMVALSLESLSNAWSRCQSAASENVRIAARNVSPVPGMPIKTPKLLRSPVVIPDRDPKAQPGLIDLTAFYDVPLTESFHSRKPDDNLAEIPRGLQLLAGVEFDARGVIQLQGSELLKARGAIFRKDVRGIPVNLRCAKLHALLGTAAPEVEGTQIGAFILHYADDERAELPILYGRHARDWWVRADDNEKQLKNAVLAWVGENQYTRKAGGQRRFYKATWDNPRPDMEVDSVDFVSTMTRCGPFLIAITAE